MKTISCSVPLRSVGLDSSTCAWPIRESFLPLVASWLQDHCLCSCHHSLSGLCPNHSGGGGSLFLYLSLFRWKILLRIPRQIPSPCLLAQLGLELPVSPGRREWMA